MSRQELADAANQYLFDHPERCGKQAGNLDAKYIGKLERGTYRWPNNCYREALRHVLNAASDAQLGFHITRRQADAIARDAQPGVSDLDPQPVLERAGSARRPVGFRPTDNGSRQLSADGDVDRRGALQLGSAFAVGLTGSPSVGRHDRAAGLWQALMGYRPWGLPEDGDGCPSLGELTAQVNQAKRAYQACKYGQVLQLLPSLLVRARLAGDAATGTDSSAVQSAIADAFQVTGSVLLKLGDSTLAAFAAERSMQAALRSQNPVTIGASTRIVVHTLTGGGHASAASDVAGRAAQQLATDVPDPDTDALSVFGALLLRGAAAAAVAEDRTSAGLLLDEAREAARRLGRDDNAHWTGFGPTNVALHEVHIATVLGDAGTAVDLARHIDPNQIALLERRASFFIDIARLGHLSA
jgi:hypothetical protein